MDPSGNAARSALTETTIRAALRRRRASREDLFDGHGLMLRITPRGTATWSLRLRVRGEGGTTGRGHKLKGDKHRISLGTYPDVSLAEARARAAAHRAGADRGESPVARLERAATAGGLTVERLAERFLREHVRSRELRSARKYEQAVQVHIVPRLGRALADTLTREQVRRMLEQARAKHDGDAGRVRGGLEAARTALGVLRQMLAWGTREQLLQRADNPASGMEDSLPEKRQRDRVLSLDEARVVWRAAETLGYPFAHAYRLLLLTGCRKGEWARAVWSWVDFRQALLVIPAESYKSGHVHVVPLVPQALSTLRDIREHHRGAAGAYILSGTSGERPLAGFSKGHERMLRGVIAEQGEPLREPWTAHDLRRTVATRLAETLGVGGEQLIRRVLGHSDGSVTAIYNRYGYVREMRAALESWAAELTA